MEQLISASVAADRFSTGLLGLLSVLALVLAGTGVYGVVSAAVQQRTHEIGVRMALGAQRSDVRRMVVGQGMVLVPSGIAIGSVAAMVWTRLMKTLLFGVGATDLPPLLAIALLLALVAMAACYFPARRATRIDPVVSLRNE